jgi:hypothetical protein
MRLPFARLTLALLLVLACVLPGCASAPHEGAEARVITSRSELVGGDRALGDIGDYLLQNDKIRVVIQQPGFSRGFGVYGGSLIDADLRRPRETGNSGEGVGFDQFGELFPAFFVQAVNVSTVRVLNDGASGGPARIEARGEAGDFLELLAILNRAVTGSNVDYQSLNSQAKLRYTTVYELEPGKQYVTIRFKTQNITQETLKFPGDEAVRLLGLLSLNTQEFKVPLTDIALFGATSQVWVPGIGFDIRFGLEEAYKRKVDFPAFPGLVTEFVASRGQGVSYGLVPGKSKDNYVFTKRALYEDGKSPIEEDSILIPFAASSFLGMFYQNAPSELAPGKDFEVVKHFVVGGGDVGSVSDVIHEIKGLSTGTVGGRVTDEITGVAAAGTSVIVYKRDPKTQAPRIYTEFDVQPSGNFTGTLPPGLYTAKVVGPNRPSTPTQDFEIKATQSVALSFSSATPGRVVVNFVDEDGHPLPAKATVVGQYASTEAGKPTRQFLFDLQAGERFRPSDLVDDDPSRPETLSFIEHVGYANRGAALVAVRPGSYDVYGSRGPEYTVARSRVDVRSDETVTVNLVLRRVVDTAGWVAADTHIHSKNSIDSPLDLDDRVRSLAAEGVEWAVSTDHNFITDYAPYIARNDLQPYMFSSVGLEMTTLESGHFNGYPLRYAPGPVTKGAFEWAGRPPEQVFEDIRGLGSLGRDRTIVQVNHPRDSILGYFSQYQRDPINGEELPKGLVQQVIAPKGKAFQKADGASAFSLAFDAMEVANGKLFWQIHHYRVPPEIPAGAKPAQIPPTGTILRKASGELGFPGVVEEWFSFLNKGRKYIAVGTCDTHDAQDEAGHFRTMVYVGDDRPAALSDEKMYAAMQSRAVVATNGPMLDFYVDDPKTGSMGKTAKAARPDAVTLVLRLTAAPWLSVGRVNVYRNGVIAKSLVVDSARDLAKDPLRESLELPLAKDSAGTPIDSWFVVEAIGYQSMFPVIKPFEVPPVLLTDAVASLAGPLGIASDEFGELRPPAIFPVTAYAITNPVWITTHTGAFRAPGPVPFEVLNAPENDPKFQTGIRAKSTLYATEPKAMMRAMTELSRRREPGREVPLFYPRADNPFDVRKALSRFGHLRGHGE